MACTCSNWTFCRKLPDCRYPTPDPSPMISVRQKDKTAEWLAIDMEDEIGYPIVIPLFGPDHHIGLDCSCGPVLHEGVIVHNAIQ